MKYQQLVQIRKGKGKEIASTKKVRQEGKYWIVPSQSRKAECVIWAAARPMNLNEILLKVLCHNICVLIQQMFELSIEPDFLKWDFNAN